MVVSDICQLFDKHKSLQFSLCKVVYSLVLLIFI